MTPLNQGFEYREVLGADAAGLRMIDYLTRRYSAFTREDWLNRIESGRVLLDGTPSTCGAILRPGQHLSWLRPPWEEPEAPLSFAILYQDAHLLAVAKPRGLPTNPGGGGFMEHTLLIACPSPFLGSQPFASTGSRDFGNCPVRDNAGGSFENLSGMALR